MPRQCEFASDTKLPVVDVVPLEQTGCDPGRDRDPESGSFGNAQKQCRRFGFVRSRIRRLGSPARRLMRRLSTLEEALPSKTMHALQTYEKKPFSRLTFFSLQTGDASKLVANLAHTTCVGRFGASQ